MTQTIQQLHAAHTRSLEAVAAASKARRETRLARRTATDTAKAADDYHAAQLAYKQALKAADVTRVALGGRTELSLNERLALLGFATSPAGRGKKNVLHNGEILFTGRAGEVWDWLIATGRLVR